MSIIRGVLWIIGVILLVMIGIQFISSSGSLQEMDSNRFFQVLKKGDIEKIVIVNKEKVEIYIKPDRLSDPKYDDVKSQKTNTVLGQTVPQYYFTIISQDVFVGRLNEVMNDLPVDNRPTYTTATRRNYVGEIMLWVIPVIIIALVLSILNNRRRRVREMKTKESNNSDFKDKIEKLNSLMKEGLITEQEFNEKKAEILRRI